MQSKESSIVIALDQILTKNVNFEHYLKLELVVLLIHNSVKLIAVN